VRRLLQAFEIDCVLDVGANKGQYHDFLRSEVGYEGKIVSFEPIPDHVEILRRRAASERAWFIEGCALGRSPGRATFNIMANTEFSSFLQPDHSNAGSFGGRNEVEREIAVEVKTINDIVPALQARLGVHRLYLKLDTQGFDLEVIGGSHDQLKHVWALQTEISMKAIYHNMPSYTEAIRVMDSLGFSISGIYPNHPEHFPEAVEFDCILVNRSLVRHQDLIAGKVEDLTR